jgi:hypothetical protein
MTISIAWVRKRKDYEEMFFASDSRLSGGQTFDACPKMLALPRQDSAIAFAGVSGDGFSMMLQLSLAVDAFAPAKHRALRLPSLKAHALNIFNEMSKRITSDVRGAEAGFTDPGASFLLGGYDWGSKCFELWLLKFDKGAHEYTAHPSATLCWNTKERKLKFRAEPNKKNLPIGIIGFAGDQAGAARRMLYSRLTKRLEAGEQVNDLHMEPLAVVRDLLKRPSERKPANSQTIGGPPQVIRVSQNAQATPLAVFWKFKNRRQLHLQGRPCLSYEILDTYSIDPENMKFEYLGHSGSDYRAVDEALQDEMNPNTDSGQGLSRP